MNYFYVLFSTLLVSVNLSATTGNWSTYFETYQPPSLYGFTLDEAQALKNDATFEKYLSERLQSLSSIMVKNAQSLEAPIHGAGLTGFSHALIISLSHYIPLASNEMAELDRTSGSLGAIDEARIFFAQNYPLTTGEAQEYCLKTALPVDQIVLNWLLAKTKEIKQSISTTFKTNVLEINAPCMPRFIALALIKEMESEEFYHCCFLPLYLEFSGQKKKLFSYPSDVVLVTLFKKLSDEKIKGSVFLKTNLVGEMIAKTIIKSIGDLPDATKYSLAEVLYPVSLDFLTPFNAWLERPLLYPTEAPRSYLPNQSYGTSLNAWLEGQFLHSTGALHKNVDNQLDRTSHFLATSSKKVENIIDSNSYFNQQFQEYSLKLSETIVATYNRAFNNQDTKILFSILLVLNKALDLKIADEAIVPYEYSVSSLWQESLSSIKDEINEQFRKHEEAASTTPTKEQKHAIKRLLLLELLCQDNNFEQIFDHLVDEIAQSITQDPFLELRKVVTIKDLQPYDFLTRSLLEMFSFYL